MISSLVVSIKELLQINKNTVKSKILIRSHCHLNSRPSYLGQKFTLKLTSKIFQTSRKSLSPLIWFINKKPKCSCSKSLSPFIYKSLFMIAYDGNSRPRQYYLNILIIPSTLSLSQFFVNIHTKKMQALLKPRRKLCCYSFRRLQ